MAAVVVAVGLSLPPPINPSAKWSLGEQIFQIRRSVPSLRLRKCVPSSPKTLALLAPCCSLYSSLPRPILGVRRGDVLKCAAYAGRNRGRLGYGDEFEDQPFWSIWTGQLIGTLKTLLVFLIEQPSQLKYIEWPSFKSTLKTATLTLVLVALFIIALSSIDSAFCYILASILRRTH